MSAGDSFRTRVRFSASPLWIAPLLATGVFFFLHDGNFTKGTQVRLRKLVGLLTLIVLAIVCYGVLVALAQPAPSHPFFAPWRAQRFPIVIAHRGGMGIWPENTLHAFGRAVAAGVEMIEMDVRSTSDGVLVLMHDSTVDRTTDGTGPVTMFNLEELRGLDAGYNWSSDGGITFPFRDQRVMVPTLEEVFTTMPGLHMSVEIKQDHPSISAPLCALIQKHRMTEKVLVSSSTTSVLDKFRRACPKVSTSGSDDEARVFSILNLVFLGATYQPGFHVMQVPEVRSGLRVVTPFFVETAHERNLQVYVWAINDDEDIQRMINLGVDGIITDYPDRALALLGR